MSARRPAAPLAPKFIDDGHGHWIPIPDALARYGEQKKGIIPAMIRFILQATVYWSDGRFGEGHRHAVNILIREFMEGIWSRDGRRCRVLPVAASRAAVTRALRQMRRDGVLFADTEQFHEGAGCPGDPVNCIRLPRKGVGVNDQRHPGGVWVGGRMPTLYSLALDQCPRCHAPMPKRVPANRVASRPASLASPVAVPDPTVHAYNQSRRRGEPRPPNPAPPLSVRPIATTPATAEWIDKLDERSKLIGRNVQYFMSRGYNDKPLQPHLFPRPAVLAEIVAAWGDCPLDAFQLLAEYLIRRGQEPFDGKNGPWSDGWWVKTVFLQLGQFYGAPVPERLKKDRNMILGMKNGALAGRSTPYERARPARRPQPPPTERLAFEAGPRSNKTESIADIVAGLGFSIEEPGSRDP